MVGQKHYPAVIGYIDYFDVRNVTYRVFKIVRFSDPVYLLMLVFL